MLLLMMMMTLAYLSSYSSHRVVTSREMLSHALMHNEIFHPPFSLEKGFERGGQTWYRTHGNTDKRYFSTKAR